MIVPFQTPVPSVPTEVREERVVTVELTRVPPEGSVMLVAPPMVKVRPPVPVSVKADPSATAFPPIFPTVVASDPPVFVTSPVMAGNCAAAKAPVKAVVGTPVRLAPLREEK